MGVHICRKRAFDDGLKHILKYDMRSSDILPTRLAERAPYSLQRILNCKNLTTKEHLVNKQCVFTLTEHLFKELCAEINAQMVVHVKYSCHKGFFLPFCTRPQLIWKTLRWVRGFLHNRRKQSSFITGKPEQVLLSSSDRFDGCDTACTQTLWNQLLGFIKVLSEHSLSVSLLHTESGLSRNLWEKVWNKHMNRSEGANGWGWVINRNITRYNNSCRGVFVGTQTRSSVINK